MASSFEKSVKGATKVKLAAPKAKYVEHILVATHAGEAGIAEVFRALSNRLRDGAWTIVFKSLIVVHYMIREGEMEVTLRYLRRNPRMIALTHYSDVQTQGRNIRNYSNYLNERARGFGEVRTDFVRAGEGRLRKLSVEKGLLREVECVQQQIAALLKCTFLEQDVDNEITLLAFRLLVSDLLVLFHVVNEGMINLLEHYFEMSRFDAERALQIYKVFTRQTADVVEYLQQARGVEPSTRLQIPNIKHAPTSLTSSLEEYLHDPDFDTNRRQYLAQQEAKKTGGKPPASRAMAPQPGKTSTAQNEPTPAPPSADSQPKIAPDLIDFFDSIETQQTPMFANIDQQQQMQLQLQNAYQQGGAPFGHQDPPMPVPQMTNQTGGVFPMGYPQQGNPYPQQAQQLQMNQVPPQPVQTNFTGAGFGGYTPQDQNAVTAPPMPTIPQQFAQQLPPPQGPPQLNLPPQQQQPPQDTNPFRASMMMTGASNSSFGGLATSPTKSHNPFARSASVSSPPNSTPFTPQSPPRVSLQPTGTNPFARNTSPVNASSPPISGGLSAPVPGSAATNPFRASMMLQQQQAQQQAQMNGNFSGQTGTMSGWEAVETVPVFPRNPTGPPPLNNQTTGWQ